MFRILFLIALTFTSALAQEISTDGLYTLETGNFLGESMTLETTGIVYFHPRSFIGTEGPYTLIGDEMWFEGEYEHHILLLEGSPEDVLAGLPRFLRFHYRKKRDLGWLDR